MSDNDYPDLPWPHGGDTFDPYDFRRVGHAIHDAILSAPPGERDQLLDTVGQDPAASTLMRIRPDTVGVVVAGDVVLEIDKTAIRGIDRDKLVDAFSAAVDMLPDHASEEIREAIEGEDGFEVAFDLLTVQAPVDFDFVQLFWGDIPIAKVDRSRVIHDD